MSETVSAAEPGARRSLGAITEPVVDQSGPSPSDSSFTYIDIGSIDNATKRVVEPKVFVFKDAPSRARQRLQAGDVLVSMTRPNLNAVAIVPREFDGAIASTGFHVLRGRDVRPEWLFYAVQTPEFIDAMCRRVQGALYPAVRPKDVRAYEIPVPATRVQVRLVAQLGEQLSRLEAGVASLKRVEIELRRYRAAILKAACEGRLVPTEADLARLEGRSYENGMALVDRVAACSLNPTKTTATHNPSGPGSGAVPNGWAQAQLGTLSTLVEYGTSAKCADKGDVPVLRMGNIESGELVTGRLKYLPSSHHEFPALLLATGDLLFNRTNSAELVGKTAVYRGAPARCSFASYLLRVRLANGCEPKFFCYLLNSAHGRAWIRAVVSQQVGQANVNSTKLRALVVPVPPAAEQRRIVAEVERRLSVIQMLAATVEVNLARASRLRQAILSAAFSGHTRSASLPQASVAARQVTAQRRHFARAVLSGEIVHRLHGEPTFGRVKHQKIFHLCEHIARLPEIQGEYHREAAGPLDNRLIHANATELKKQKWYEQVERTGVGHEYRPLAKAGAHRQYAERWWTDQLPTVKRLIEMMRTWKTERCEIFSTVYAVWNDLVLWGREVTDDAIVHEILHRWHESKKRIPEDKWRAAIGWMRREGFVPTGFGRPTATAAPDDGRPSGR